MTKVDSLKKLMHEEAQYIEFLSRDLAQIKKPLRTFSVFPWRTVSVSGPRR